MLLFPVHPVTRDRLINLFNGDVKACEALVNRIKRQNPEMNEQRCYGEAIKQVTSAKT